MNIPEEAIEATRIALEAELGGPVGEHVTRAALEAAAPLLIVGAQGRELNAGELLELPDGSIVIDAYGNPNRIEDGHVGRMVTLGDFPFRVVFIPAK